MISKDTKRCRVCTRVVLLIDFNTARYRCNKCVDTNKLLSAEQRVMENRGWNIDHIVKLWKMWKACPKCKTRKHGWEFGLSSQTKLGLTSWCKVCESTKKRNPRYIPSPEKAKEYKAKHKEANKGKVNPKSLHGQAISEEYYENLFKLQGGKCGICETPQSELTKNLAIDHDHNCCPTKHTCGKCVRGLLCQNCNTGLGLFRDNPEMLKKALQYLDRKSTLLIALAGYSGCGKDSASELLIEKYGMVRVAFADKLRKFVYTFNSTIQLGSGEYVRLQDIIDDLGWEKAKREYPQIREALQNHGITMRDIAGEDIWVNQVLPTSPAKFREMYPMGAVITDLRFDNEAERVKSLGGIIINIVRQGVGPVNSHVSEKGVKADYTIENVEGRPESMLEQIDAILAKRDKWEKESSWGIHSDQAIE